MNSVIDTYWTAFNLDFDKKFLVREPWKLTAPPWKCLMMGFHELRKSQVSPEDAKQMKILIPWEDPYKYPSAQEAAEEAAAFFTGYAFAPEQTHRALDDVYQNIAILEYLLIK